MCVCACVGMFMSVLFTAERMLVYLCFNCESVWSLM